MKILYIIALVSFAALAWAAFAITRHVRKSATPAKPLATEAEDSIALQDRLSGLSRSGERKVAPIAIDRHLRPAADTNQPDEDKHHEPLSPTAIDHQ